MLVATGRAANLEDVGLETTRAVVERGIVVTDEHMRTADPHLYAVGDIAGGLWLAHVATHEGIRRSSPSPATTPSRAGLREDAARHLLAAAGRLDRPHLRAVRRAGHQDEGGQDADHGVGKAIIDGDTTGFVKVIADAKTDELLGVHMIGHHVTELHRESSTAMLLEATAWEIGAAVHPHPTLSETMGEAALAVDGKSINF